jgi:hypothetical protein
MSDPTTIPDQLDSIAARFAEGSARMERIEVAQVAAERRMKRMEDQLKENTDLTRDLKQGQDENSELLKDIKDGVTFGRVGWKLIKWFGALGAAAVGLWGFIELFTRGRPPH